MQSWLYGHLVAVALILVSGFVLLRSSAAFVRTANPPTVLMPEDGDGNDPEAKQAVVYSEFR